MKKKISTKVDVCFADETQKLILSISMLHISTYKIPYWLKLLEEIYII